MADLFNLFGAPKTTTTSGVTATANTGTSGYTAVTKPLPVTTTATSTAPRITADNTATLTSRNVQYVLGAMPGYWQKREEMRLNREAEERRRLRLLAAGQPYRWRPPPAYLSYVLGNYETDLKAVGFLDKYGKVTAAIRNYPVLQQAWNKITATPTSSTVAETKIAAGIPLAPGVPIPAGSGATTRPPAAEQAFESAADQSALRRPITESQPPQDPPPAPATQAATSASANSTTLDRAQPFAQAAAALEGVQSTRTASAPVTQDMTKAIERAKTQFRSQRSGYSGNRRWHPFSG